MHEQKGNKNEAIADYKKALEIDPSNSIAKPLLEALGAIKPNQ